MLGVARIQHDATDRILEEPEQVREGVCRHNLGLARIILENDARLIAVPGEVNDRR
jgi:hypothetical protein